MNFLKIITFFLLCVWAFDEKIYQWAVEICHANGKTSMSCLTAETEAYTSLCLHEQDVYPYMCKDFLSFRKSIEFMLEAAKEVEYNVEV